MNSIQLIGNISSDIDLKAVNNGKFVAKFSIAVNNPFKRDKTSFLPVEVWGATAENTANFCQKGSKIGIVGYIEVETWDKDGEKKYKTKVCANSIEFLTPKKEGQQQNTQQSNNYTPPTKVDEDPFAGNGTIDIDSDDLPF
jgi:single-strand DNA-binding protein